MIGTVQIWLQWWCGATTVMEVACAVEKEVEDGVIVVARGSRVADED